MPRPVTHTFFDPKFHFGFEFPSPNSKIFPNVDRKEVAIFARHFENEKPIWNWSQSFLCGEITIRDQKHTIRCEKAGGYVLPPCVEPDVLGIVECKAKGVIVIPDLKAYHLLIAHRTWKTTNNLLLYTEGLPTYSVRRFLNRLCRELSLPVYVLSDNDEWGYFLFSVLKRGSIDVSKQSRFLQVAQSRFLGLRAGDSRFTAKESEYIYPLEKSSRLRMRFLSRYSCFKAPKWKQEFEAFSRQNGSLRLEMAICCFYGPRSFGKRYIQERLAGGEWLA